jgi:anti-sigma regulatory factor (Ser/Thr protein kinase)
MQGKRLQNPAGTQQAVWSHELRNVLSGVLGATELLSQSSLDCEQQHLIRTLQQSARQLCWLIESMGGEEPGSSFPFKPRLAVFNGVDLLEQMVRCHTPASGLKQNLLLLSIDPDLAAWWCSDAPLLRLLIGNLLGNAIKFTQSGRVEIEARNAKGDGHTVEGLELWVRDTGPGISRAECQRIFEPWVQLENTKKREGSGLGLYICQRIVSCLGGELDCHFEEAGSCFRVYLPKIFVPIEEYEPAQTCGLFSTLSCQVSVEGALDYSIRALLRRLEIRIGSSEKEQGPTPDSELKIRISGPKFPRDDPSLRPYLLLTHQSPANSGQPGFHSRRLQTPILESTLAPLLLEMAIEWRQSLQLNPPTALV